MSDIDRIAEKCVQCQHECEQAADERVCVKTALLEYAAIVREECAKECDLMRRHCPQDER